MNTTAAIIVRNAGSDSEELVGSLCNGTLELRGRVWPLASGIAFIVRTGLSILWIE